MQNLTESHRFSDSKKTSRLPLNRYGVSFHRDSIQTTVGSDGYCLVRLIRWGAGTEESHLPTPFSTNGHRLLSNFLEIWIYRPIFYLEELFGDRNRPSTYSVQAFRYTYSAPPRPDLICAVPPRFARSVSRFGTRDIFLIAMCMILINIFVIAFAILSYVSALTRLIANDARDVEARSGSAVSLKFVKIFVEKLYGMYDYLNHNIRQLIC